jgi:hemerythrin-like domain-containing protein
LFLIKLLNSTQNLKSDHSIVRRLGQIAKICSMKLYKDEDIPIEDLEIISVVMEEFVDRFHHGKEEQSYFPQTKDKDGFSEDIRKFLIEHELGRRIAKMFRKELEEMKNNIENISNKEKSRGNISQIKEPVARFLKAYSVFITDHTHKEDKFFDLIENKHSISDEEDIQIKQHYENCKNRIGGETRIQKMLDLLKYLENREWKT